MISEMSKEFKEAIVCDWYSTAPQYSGFKYHWLSFMEFYNMYLMGGEL